MEAEELGRLGWLSEHRLSESEFFKVAAREFKCKPIPGRVRRNDEEEEEETGIEASSALASTVAELGFPAISKSRHLLRMFPLCRLDRSFTITTKENYNLRFPLAFIEPKY